MRNIPQSSRMHCSADSIINVALPGSKTLQISDALTCFRAVCTHQNAHAVATQHRITAGGLPTGHTCTGIATAMFGEPWEQEGVSLGFEPQFVAHRPDGMMHPLCLVQALAALLPSSPPPLMPSVPSAHEKAYLPLSCHHRVRTALSCQWILCLDPCHPCHPCHPAVIALLVLKNCAPCFRV